MPLCPQITNTPITVTQTADFTVTSVVPAIANTQDGLTNNLDSIEILADGKTKVYRQAAPPTVAGINDGDLWIDTDDGNKLYVRVSGAWVSAQDASIGTAQTTANNAAIAAGNAQTTANSALADAATAYTAAIGSLQPSASTIVNASKQITAIAANGITVYSGASSSTGARVVMNSAGLAGYDASNNATFSITASTGAAVFSGSVTGAAITGSSLNIAGKFIVDGTTGVMTATDATVTGTINATAGYFGTSTNGWSIGSVGLTGVGTGAITGGTIQTSSGNTAIIMNGGSNALQFKVSGSISGNIVPLGVAGILMHYGATPDPTGATYPKVQMSSNTALLQAAASIYVQSTTTGNSASGNFRMFNDLQVDGTTSFQGASNSFPNITQSTSAANLRWGTTTGGRIFESTASSARFKTDIVDLLSVPELNPKLLLNLPVHAFRYRDDYLGQEDERSGVLVPGFIAEEVDAIYPIVADYEMGQPNNWNDKFLVPAMLSLIQDLYKEIKTLKGE